MKISSPEGMAGERYFQIRNVGSDGCGSFKLVVAKEGMIDDEIGELVAQQWTAEMLRQMDMYSPGAFSRPPKWRNTLKVVEQTREVKRLDEVSERTGRDYTNVWKTKRGGFKFKIVKTWLNIKMENGDEYNGRGYSYSNNTHRL